MKTDLVYLNWGNKYVTLTIFEGAVQFINGDRYEGTIKDGKMDGNGNLDRLIYYKRRKIFIYILYFPLVKGTLFYPSKAKYMG